MDLSTELRQGAAVLSCAIDRITEATAARSDDTGEA
jgi:hypothetical protein